jgi:hypothetical protein
MDRVTSRMVVVFNYESIKFSPRPSDSGAYNANPSNLEI